MLAFHVLQSPHSPACHSLTMNDSDFQLVVRENRSKIKWWKMKNDWNDSSLSPFWELKKYIFRRKSKNSWMKNMRSRLCTRFKWFSEKKKLFQSFLMMCLQAHSRCEWMNIQCSIAICISIESEEHFFFARIMISKVIFYAFIRRYRVNAAFKNAIKKVRSSYLWFQNCAEILRFLSSMTRRVHVSINQKFKINNLLVLITYILYIEFRKNEHWMRRKMKMQQFSLLVIG